jgi:diacylglycerol kinase family enzyme
VIPGVIPALIPAFVNSRAEEGDAARRALASRGGFTIHDLPPERLESALHDAIARGARRVVVAGGDGSLRTAAGVLAGGPIELAILPGGRLKHFANDHGIPADLHAAADLALTGHAVPVDVARVNGSLFLNTSSVGTYASFVRAREHLEPRLGYRLASLVAAARMLVHTHSARVTIDVDGELREYRTPLVFIGTGERELRVPMLGRRVRGWRPGIHVRVVRHRSGAGLLALALAVAARGVESVARTPSLDAFLVQHCTVETSDTAIALDGELVTLHPPLRYVLVPGGLQVVTRPGPRAPVP